MPRDNSYDASFVDFLAEWLDDTPDEQRKAALPELVRDIRMHFEMEGEQRSYGLPAFTLKSEADEKLRRTQTEATRVETNLRAELVRAREDAEYWRCRAADAEAKVGPR